VAQRELADGVIAFQATELERGRQAEGHRHDGVGVITFVLVLM
jgi:hypothetical protein